MVGIPGIGYPTGPANITDPTGRKSAADITTAPAPEDGVQFSPQGERASTVATLLAQSNAQDQIRAAQVAQAKQRLAEGAHRIQEVVTIVAARISKFLDNTPAGKVAPPTGTN